MKTLTENGVQIVLEDQFNSPEQSKVFFNPKMQINRELVLCALTAFLSDRIGKPPSCLDVFGATGVTGLQWLKHHGQKADIAICDLKQDAVTSIQHNCALNGVKVKGDRSEEGSGVEVICEDANVLLHQRAFDFVHLDPFGCTVQYLDATFRNVPNHGIVSISSMDTSALFCKCDRVTLRHYQAQLSRTEYMKELAVRLVVTAAVRAAARCNKGVEVLLSTAAEHFVLVILRIKRGPSKADSCMQNIQQVFHCQMCLERVFVKPSLILHDNPYKWLECKCQQSTPGHTAVCIGPVWSGSIFNAHFVQRMMQAARQHGLGKKTQQFLQLIHQEAKCAHENVRTKSESHTQESSPKLTSQRKMSDALNSHQDDGQNTVVKEKQVLASTDITSGCDLNTRGIVTKEEPPEDESEIYDKSVIKSTTDVQMAEGRETNLGNGVKPNQERTEASSAPIPSHSHVMSSADEILPPFPACIATQATEDNDVNCGKRKNRQEDAALGDTAVKDSGKRVCTDACITEQEPVFYYNIHNHSVKDMDSPKLNVLIDNLHQSGFRASRTHFDAQGVRTNASKAQFTAVLSKCSPPTRK